jgi:acyl-coenzyme A thioesterase PaaI-like protein
LVQNSRPEKENPMKSSYLRWRLNLYPPYFGTGIRVTHIAEDYRRIVVEMPLRWYNRNYVGTHFGGSLSAMTDPYYMLMLIQILGRDYIVWDQAGTIEYRKPGRGRVRAEFVIEDHLIEEIRQATAGGSKCLRVLPVDIHDEEGDVVAHVTRTLYIRRK